MDNRSLRSTSARYLRSTTTAVPTRSPSTAATLPSPVSVPLIISAAAYNPPTSDSEGAPDYAAATPATLAAFGNQYLPQRGQAVDTDDVNGNGNSTEILPEETNAIRVLASGSMVGSELTATSAAGPFSPSTTVPAGSPAVLQQVITNVLPATVTNVRVYDTLPAAGDAAGSTSPRC